MARPTAHVLATGIANLASVMAGLERAGANPRPTTEPRDVKAADFLVLPGVGAFGAAMEVLRSRGLDVELTSRVHAGRPTLAVCLGLQLLFESSEESEGVRGLGVVPGEVQRFPGGVRVPHFGWNRVEPEPECSLLRAGYAYFANSYRVTETPAGWKAAHTDHGGRFVCALQRGAVLACQFHPELSGQWGVELMERWLMGEGKRRFSSR